MLSSRITHFFDQHSTVVSGDMESKLLTTAEADAVFALACQMRNPK